LRFGHESVIDFDRGPVQPQTAEPTFRPFVARLIESATHEETPLQKRLAEWEELGQALQV
jgi:hypothetical protein